jgi:hypothetical protein
MKAIRILDPMSTELEKLIPKTNLRQQLHQTGIEMLSRCQVQFEFRYLKGIRRPPNAFLICGSATHKAVDVDLNHKIETGDLEQESTLLDVARDAVENHPEKDNIELEEDEQGQSKEQVISGTKDKAVRLVKAHHGEIAPNIQPAQTARRFSINLDKWLRTKGKEFHERAENASSRILRKILHQQAAHMNAAAKIGMDFVGEQDIVERFGQALVIRDTKTSKKSPSANTADESHQLSAYATASRVLDGKVPDAVKLDYLVDLKSGTKTMTLESVRDESDVQKYLNRLIPAIAAIRSGNFVPAPDTAWWCSSKWCAYHSMCPYVRHKETTVGNLENLLKESLAKLQEMPK